MFVKGDLLSTFYKHFIMIAGTNFCSAFYIYGRSSYRCSWRSYAVTVWNTVYLTAHVLQEYDNGKCSLSSWQTTNSPANEHISSRFISQICILYPAQSPTSAEMNGGRRWTSGTPRRGIRCGSLAHWVSAQIVSGYSSSSQLAPSFRCV